MCLNLCPQSAQSQTIDQATIEFSTIFGLLLTKTCYCLRLYCILRIVSTEGIICKLYLQDMRDQQGQMKMVLSIYCPQLNMATLIIKFCYLNSCTQLCVSEIADIKTKLLHANTGILDFITNYRDMYYRHGVQQ